MPSLLSSVKVWARLVTPAAGGMKRLGELAESLDDDTIERFAKKVEHLKLKQNPQKVLNFSLICGTIFYYV